MTLFWLRFRNQNTLISSWYQYQFLVYILIIIFIMINFCQWDDTFFTYSFNLLLILQPLIFWLRFRNQNHWYQANININFWSINYVINKSIIKLNNLYYIINLVNNTTNYKFITYHFLFYISFQNKLAVKMLS